MARAMLEYTKTVLDKVSFDVTLFCREVKKALERLLPYEIEELKDLYQITGFTESTIKPVFNLP